MKLEHVKTIAKLEKNQHFLKFKVLCKLVIFSPIVSAYTQCKVEYNCSIDRENVTPVQNKRNETILPNEILHLENCKQNIIHIQRERLIGHRLFVICILISLAVHASQKCQ